MGALGKEALHILLLILSLFLYTFVSLALFGDLYRQVSSLSLLLSRCIYIERQTCLSLSFLPPRLPLLFFFLPEFPFGLILIRSMCYILDRWKTKHSRESFRHLIFYFVYVGTCLHLLKMLS